MPNWRSECFLCRFTGHKALAQCRMFHAVFVRPFDHRFCLPPKSQKNITTSVAALLLLCGPSAVFLAVWAVIIASIQCVGGPRFRPHVGKKILKCINPRLAYINSSSAILWILFISWIKTTAAHTAPSMPFTCFSHTVSCVRFTKITHVFFKKASAASYRTACHMSDAANVVISTLAQKAPYSVAALARFWRALNERQSLECIAGCNRSSHVYHP